MFFVLWEDCKRAEFVFCLLVPDTESHLKAHFDFIVRELSLQMLAARKMRVLRADGAFENVMSKAFPNPTGNICSSVEKQGIAFGVFAIPKQEKARSGKISTDRKHEVCRKTKPPRVRTDTRRNFQSLI